MQLIEASRSSDMRFLPDPSGLRQAHSIDEAVHMVGACLSEHKLRVNNGAPDALASLSALSLGDCAIVSLKYGFDVDIDAGNIANFFMLKMTVAGAGRITSDEHVATTRPESIFVTSPYSKTRFRMSSSCRHLTTRVCRRAVEDRLMQKIGRRLHVPLEFELEIGSDTEFGRAWWQLMGHICELSAAAPGVLASDEMRAQYSRTIIELLLQSAPHNYSDAMHLSESHVSPRHVRRAQEYIEAHLAEIRSVVDVAEAIGVSPRTLQNGFKQTLNVSPLEYLRHARVQALHRALLAADGSQSVTSLMTSVGIMSFGRYAEYYRKQIGVAPSLTLRQGA
jgi:methylphosphotriester-DNA--protein-cysteine methyltransferase